MESATLKLADAVALDASKVLFSQNIRNVLSFALEIEITGTPQGALYVEGSITGAEGRWFSLENPLALAGAAINKFYSWSVYPVPYLRVRYVRTSGDGFASIDSFAKSHG